VPKCLINKRFGTFLFPE